MNDALMYFLKVNIAIALFYIFYRLVFYNDTFWATRRFYLLFSVLLSVVYPFISLSGWLEKQEPMQAIMTNYVQLDEITVSAAPGATPYTLENGLLVIYGLVSTFLLARMMVQLISIIRWRLKGKRQILQGIEIVAIDGTITPFSFFTTIFMNPELHTDQETRQILIHERTHARQRHSLDVLLSEMLTIACWINPTVWLLKHEIRQNLEFLADNSVLQSGIEPRNYQYHLLQLSYQTPQVDLVNKFNVSPLKKRIIMMNQEKSSKAGMLKYSLIVPLALALVLSSNAQSIINSAKQEMTTTKATASQSPDKDKIYTVVDKMPGFPGGEKALFNYISHTIKYPVEDQLYGVQGKVIVRFAVSATGKVENAEVIRGLSPAKDKEALRVINSLPNFTPGEQNSKKVAVYYTLPITYKLDNGSSNLDKTSESKLAAERESVNRDKAMQAKLKAEKETERASINRDKAMDSKLKAEKEKQRASINQDRAMEAKLKAEKEKERTSINREPLYIADGKELNESEFKSLKPENIKEISVLKNASATAIYGDKGKNGVILITMKK